MTAFQEVVLHVLGIVMTPWQTLNLFLVLVALLWGAVSILGWFLGLFERDHIFGEKHIPNNDCCCQHRRGL